MTGPAPGVEGPRVLLVSANREHFPEPIFPLGVLYTAAAFARAGAAVRVFDAGRAWFPVPRLLRELAAHPPDLVGLSLRNADNASFPCTRTYLPWYRELARAIRCSPWGRARGAAPPLYLGGPAFSLFPDELLAELGAAGGVTGDAESGAGWVLAGGRGVYHAPAAPVPVGLPRGATAMFPGMRRYPTLGVQTARGCESRCIYCTYPLLEGGGFRPRDPVEVVGEIALQRDRRGTRRFFVVDASFNTDEAHAVAVLRKMIARRLDIRFSCYLQPRRGDPGFFSLLRRAGCIAVDFGTESGSDRMLSALGKNHSREDIRTASRACREEGIDFCHSLLFGGPGETAETIRETVALMDETAPRAVVAMAGIRVYPGTEMERIAREEGKVVPGEGLLAPKFYFPAMGPEGLLREVHAQSAGRRNWFFPGEKDWSSSWGPRLLRLLHREGPLWRTFKR